MEEGMVCQKQELAGMTGFVTLILFNLFSAHTADPGIQAP